MERRELIRWLVATAGLPSLHSLGADDLLALGRDVHRRSLTRSVLTRDEDRAIAAAAEAIIPAGDTPGATDAGVTAFIDKMLAHWFTEPERERFLAGLPELDTRANARAGRPFADCAAPDQVAMLTALDDEVTSLRANRGDAANEHWFAMLKFLTVYGYCTSKPGMRALGLYPLPGRYDPCAAL